MKKVRLSVIAIASLSMLNTLNANSLSDALKDGKISGDISVTYEKRNMDKEIGKYYQNTAYSVTSFGFDYKSASFYDFSIGAGFRTHGAIYEADDNSVTSHGNGDSTERFYDEDGSNMLTFLYLACDKGNNYLKVGRHYVATDWLTKIIDGASFSTNLSQDLKAQLIYAKRRGRATAREVRPMTKINGDDGIYRLGLDYKVSSNINTNAYFLNAPDSHDIYGGKVKLNFKSGDTKYGASLHVMNISEEKKKDGSMIEGKLFTTISGVTATLGHVQTGKDTGWGSAADYGDLIVPFEEGDNMYKTNAQTTYLMLSKKIAGVSLTGLYGTMSYDKAGTTYDSSEFNLWAGYSINKDTKISLGYALVKEDSADSATTDLDQINATISYKF